MFADLKLLLALISNRLPVLSEISIKPVSIPSTTELPHYRMKIMHCKIKSTAYKHKGKAAQKHST